MPEKCKKFTAIVAIAAVWLSMQNDPWQAGTQVSIALCTLRAVSVAHGRAMSDFITSTSFDDRAAAPPTVMDVLATAADLAGSDDVFAACAGVLASAKVTGPERFDIGSSSMNLDDSWEDSTFGSLGACARTDANSGSCGNSSPPADAQRARVLTGNQGTPVISLTTRVTTKLRTLWTVACSLGASFWLQFYTHGICYLLIGLWMSCATLKTYRYWFTDYFGADVDEETDSEPLPFEEDALDSLWDAAEDCVSMWHKEPSDLTAIAYADGEDEQWDFLLEMELMPQAY